MFEYQECEESLKYLARNSEFQDASYCQRLDLCSREFGFNNFQHFRKAVPKLPEDKLGKVYLRLMRTFCQSTRPELDSDYYEFYLRKGLKTDGLKRTFYSKWIGWDRFGREVRVPRPIPAKRCIDAIRDASAVPVYVIDNERQLLSWLGAWYGTALIAGTLAKTYFPSTFERHRRVCNDVDPALIDACNENYNNNLAS